MASRSPWQDRTPATAIACPSSHPAMQCHADRRLHIVLQLRSSLHRCCISNVACCLAHRTRMVYGVCCMVHAAATRLVKEITHSFGMRMVRWPTSRLTSSALVSAAHRHTVLQDAEKRRRADLRACLRPLLVSRALAQHRQRTSEQCFPFRKDRYAVKHTYCRRYTPASGLWPE